MKKALDKVVVDLTPVLPGGENGGAKIFVLELLKQLAAMAPQTQFVLLTHAVSHAELATMDRPNMRRVLVAGTTGRNSFRAHITAFGVRLLRHLPTRLRRSASRVGYRINTMFKRNGSAALLRGIGADLLFCPFTAPTYFESDIPTVCTIYDLQYKTYPEFFAPEDVAHRDRTFIEACRRSSHLAAISDYSRDSAIFHGKLDPLRIRTIHLRMAQRITLKSGEGANVLGRLGIARHRYFIYPANFWMHKNHEMLLTAFGMACDTGLPSDIKLVCTGAPGTRQTWLSGASRAMGLAERILFPGFLPNAELSVLVGSARAVIFPSLYEGFGLPVIEAMAAGVPVACSNTTSLPEVASSAAVLFDPRIPTEIAAAIHLLASDDVECARLIAAGQQRATEYSDSRRMSSEYWRLFQDAVDDVKLENSLSGFFADGWAGPVLNIQITPTTGIQTLDMSIFLPDWLPHPRLTLQTIRSGRNEGQPMHATRGEHAKWSIPLSSEGGNYEIRISPAFAPSRFGLGDDHRELTVMLENCTLRREQGECIELFQEEANA